MRRVLPLALTLLGVVLATVPLRAEEPAPQPAPAADDAAIQRLVDDLGSSDFARRERASRELLALGEKARPALERTMKSSENMEARWRAEQILKHLDREGERPMGQGVEPLRPRQAPPGGEAEAPPSPPGLDDLDRQMEELRKRLFEPFGPRGFGDFGPSRERMEAEGLRLDAEVFAGMLVQVNLLDREAARMFRGRSLEDVLERHPELAELPGMPALKERWAAFKQANPGLFRSRFGAVRPRSGFSFTQSSGGIEVTQGPDGAVVRIREKGEDGEEHVREIRGASLDEIKEKHPELRERLDGFGGFHVELGPVQIFRDRLRGLRRLPVPPMPPEAEVTPSESEREALFGVRLVAPETVLAVHLGLEPGHGALVTQVVEGSQAAALGLLRHDVIVALDGKPVVDFHAAADALRKAAAAQGPLTVEVIRRGARATLER